MGAQPVTVLAPYAPVGTGMLAPISTSQERGIAPTEMCPPTGPVTVHLRKAT